MSSGALRLVAHWVNCHLLVVGRLDADSGLWLLASRGCSPTGIELRPIRSSDPSGYGGGDDLFFRINLENKINCIIYGCVSFGNKLQGWGTRMERLNGRDKLDCLGVLF